MQPKLGILAGGGRLPALLIEACEKTSRPYAVIAFRGQVTPEAISMAEEIRWHRLGAGRAILDDLKRMDVTEVTLAGAIRRPGLMALMPDFWTLRRLLSSGALRKGDDGLLRFVAGLLENAGIKVVGTRDIAPDLLTPNGVLTNTAPDEASLHDIDVAREAARELGRQDIGQAVVARDGAVIAREDRRGTDAMLSDIEHPSNSAGVLVKCLKPGQDRRMDLPTIGENTVRQAKAAGLKGIALDANSSMIVDREATVESANRAGLFIIGLNDD